MEYLVASLFAGALTVLSPCILPLLPAVIGGAASVDDRRKRSLLHPLLIVASLAVSVFVFTLLLRASTALLGVPTQVWQIVAGIILLLLGISYAFPMAWDKIAAELNARSNKLLGKATRQQGVGRDIALGAALGPVFSSCSPTYAFIIAVILPQSITVGVVNIAAYTIGLTVVLLLIALLGQRLIAKLQWAANPYGWFRRIVGVIFILIGVAIMFGWDRDFQTFVIEQGWYAPIEQVEHVLRER